MRLRERLGASLPAVAPGAVWIHAASLGEVAAAEGLIAHLDGPVLLTVDSPVGLERARAIARERPGMAAAILPLDHPWTLAPLWADVRPRALILIEGAWWPVLAHLASRAGIPVIRASARVSRSRSLPGYRRWVSATTAVFARDQEQGAWLAAHQDAPVTVLGDLKLLRPLPPNPLRWPGPFVVAGSTRPGDEARVLSAIESGMRILLAPRHLDRVPEIFALVRRTGKNAVLRTSLVDGVVPPDADVLILDTLGELAGCWAGARSGFLGGTWDPAIGGHSPCDALAARVPLVSGPAISAQAHLARHLKVCRSIEELRQEWPNLSEAAAPPLPDIRPLLTAIHAGRPAPEASPRPWLAPLAPAVVALGAARRAVRRTLAPRPPLPLFVVGSVNPRGPGKTTTAQWWARELARRGHRPGIAARGVGGGRDGARSWIPGDPLGDEGTVLAAGSFPVAVGAWDASFRALASQSCDSVVVDDGWGLPAHRLLLVVDARFPTARGALPAGERRSWTHHPDADGAIVHHASAAFPAPVGCRAERRFGPWHRGDVPTALPGGPLAAFAGLGRSADILANLDQPAELLALADHATADPAAIRVFARGRPLVCTAKDRARLPPDLAADVWWRPMWLEVADAPERWFTLDDA